MSGEPYAGVGREHRRAPGDNSVRSRPRTEGTAVGPYAFGYTVRHSIVSNATSSRKAALNQNSIPLSKTVNTPRALERRGSSMWTLKARIKDDVYARAAQTTILATGSALALMTTTLGDPIRWSRQYAMLALSV